MNKGTLKNYRKTHKEADYVENWLKEHTDKRKATVPKHEYRKDKITRLYAGKDRRISEEK